MQSVIEAAFPWLTTLVVLPTLGALLVWWGRPVRAYAREIALAVSVVVLGLFLVAAFSEFDVTRASTYQFAETYTWIPQIGTSIAWGVNGMGLVMVGLAVFLVPVVVLASWKALPTERAWGYFAWMLFLESIMIGLFAARDVFLFYVLFELMILPVFFMIARYGREGAQRAGMKFLLYSLLGGLVMLVGVIVLYFLAGGGKQAYLLENLPATIEGSAGLKMLVFVTFMVAFAIKAPLVPVHTWLPDAAEKAPAGTSTLLVGVLDKVGTFGMIAIVLPLLPEQTTQARMVLMILAVISILWGGFMAIVAKDFMRLVAYTSVSHFGFMILAIFSGSQVAMAGAILYMVAHGVATGALFLTVGFLGERTGTHTIAAYGGWQRVTPLLAGTFFIAGMASIALPGLSGFVPEYLILVGSFKEEPVLAIIAVFGVVLAALYILLPYQRAFTGPRPNIEVPDLDGRERVVAAVLIASMLGLGFAPGAMLGVIDPVAEQSAHYSTVHATDDGAAATEEGSTK